jgi:signal transduction histidine kinase
VVPELAGSDDVLTAILTGQILRYQVPWANREQPDGSTVYLTMIDLPYQDESGQIIGIVHVIQDLTEIGRMEQRITQQRNDLRLLQAELHQQYARLEAVNVELRRLDDLKSAFISIAAHELRTPLASIIGYAEMLSDEEAGPLNEKQFEYLGIIETSARRLLHITNQLLDSSRIETGRLELVLQPTNLVDLMRSVAEEQAPQIDAKRQPLTLRADPGLPQVLCDPTRAAQILGNLLSNASKYAPRGAPITITLSCSQEDGFVQVAIADRGIGIAPEDQANLFTPFFRAGSAALTGAVGTGLGLYIAQSLAELHGGRIWLQSIPGQGSTFYVIFPFADSSEVS